MANVNIDGLPVADALADADLYEVLQGGVNKKATGTQIKTLLIGSTALKPILWGGLWNWPAGAFPTAAKAGTIYIADGDHGDVVDADYVPDGMWFISSVDGANEYSEFKYK